MLRRIKGFTLIELLIVVAIIAILAAIAVPNFLEAQTRSKVSRVRADQRTFATALEAYFVDNNVYPAQCSSVNTPGANYINTAPSNGWLRYMPTFRNKANAADALGTLTTPIGYMSTYFPDPFADTKGATFEFSTNRPTNWTMPATGWIIWSFGPDADEQARPNGKKSPYNIGGDIIIDFPTDTPTTPYIQESYYNPSLSTPSWQLTEVSYDPTNGTSSNGDVWRLKQ